MDTAIRCPKCGRPASLPRCAHCGIVLTGPVAAELWRVDVELRRLQDRRAVLLSELWQMSQAPPGAGDLARAVPVSQAGPRPQELTGRAVARLLLAAGAVLLVIAASVFTIAHWGSISPTGRLAILAAVTAVLLAAPRWLGSLRATAEAVAAVGLALTVADAYLARRIAPWHWTPPTVAAACALLAALWAGYGIVSRLTGPRLAAIALAQVTLPLAVADLAGSRPVGLALAVTSGADVALARLTARRERPPRRIYQAQAVTAWCAAGVTWLAAIVTVVPEAAVDRPPAVFWAAGTLLAAGGVGIAAGRRAVTVISGALIATGIAVPAAASLPHGWDAAAFAAAGAAVAVIAWRAGRRGSASLAAGGSAGVTTAASLGLGTAALIAMFAPHAPVGDWPQAAVAVLGPLGAALIALRTAFVQRTGAVTAAGLIAIALAAGALPQAVGLSGWWTLAWLTAATAASLGLAAWLRALVPAVTLAGCAIALAVSATAWSAGPPPRTVVELGVLTALFAVAAAVARAAPAGWTAAGGCVAAAVGLAGATGAPEPYTVPAAAVLLASGWRRLPGRSSWLAYGPGLAVLLLPSLIATWQGTSWIRPALLGLVAAGVALAGARGRLQAPLLLGAAVAVIDAGHELAPAVMTVVHHLPGWAPVAVVGLILLWAGATYEARLRDLGRAREYLAGLR